MKWGLQKVKYLCLNVVRNALSRVDDIYLEFLIMIAQSNVSMKNWAGLTLTNRVTRGQVDFFPGKTLA